MIHDAKIKKIPIMNEYESIITISINDEEVDCFCLVPYEFAQNFLRIGEILKIDLWLFDANAKIIQMAVNEIPNFRKTSEGIINRPAKKIFASQKRISERILKGLVKKIFNLYEFRIDCGAFEIDIKNEAPINLFEGQYIETRGTYQIFFLILIIVRKIHGNKVSIK